MENFAVFQPGLEDWKSIRPVAPGHFLGTGDLDRNGVSPCRVMVYVISGKMQDWLDVNGKPCRMVLATAMWLDDT